MQKDLNLQPDKSHSRAAANHTQSLGIAFPAVKAPPAQFVLQKTPGTEEDLSLQLKTPSQLRSNDTGLPDNLKSGVEQLSGFAMDDVKVHYNSQQPAQLGAFAYAQGTDIHVGPGQEQHLPHEAWHVVQQKQGRVQPTMQMKGGVPINDDAGLEQEADEMGSKAIQKKAAPPSGMLSDHPVRTPAIQRRFGDSIINLAYNQRKVGVEITEDGAGGNRMEEQAATGIYTALPVLAQQGVWTHQVNLPDETGGAHNWHVASTAAPNNTYFQGAADKKKWMKWGHINFTEDHGDIEWIVDHPTQPQGVTEYRDRLAAMSAARATLRGAFAATGLASPYYVSRAQTGVAHDVFMLNIGGGNNASAQITMESNDRAKTLQGLLEGTSHGIDQNYLDTARGASLRDADADLTAVVNTATGYFTMPGVDWSLIVAYIVGDLAHKTVALMDANQWGNAGGNWKNWRRLFPKSHPSQLILQSMNALPTATDLVNITAQLNAHRAAIIADVEALIARKVLAQKTRLEYDPVDWQASPVESARLDNTRLTGTHPGGAGGVLADMQAIILAANPGFMTAEYDNARDALVDLTGTNIGVVRSGNFAVHAGANRGFAFEDRGEITTTFPGLDTTYDRIKALVNRY